MNEDIKKILDTLKEYYDGLGWPYYPEDVLEPKDTKIIYDYITQLQNNWNELKKYVEDGIKQHGCGTTMYLTCLLKKMQELEGNNE